MKCMSVGRQKAGNPSWRVGRLVNAKGYVWVHEPTHPNANCRGYVFEHRLVMERHLGRLLLKTESVHHKNGDRADNRI